MSYLAGFLGFLFANFIFWTGGMYRFSPFGWISSFFSLWIFGAILSFFIIMIAGVIVKWIFIVIIVAFIISWIKKKL